jgi:DNA-binding NarL/FixJ family response regulator
MHRVRLVLADRRPIVLQGLVSLFGEQPDFEVVACCLDGASCLAAIRRLTPDVALLEDGFTDVTASDLLAAVNDERLSSRLVFFTATVACGDLARAMATGACGAVPMNAKPDALVQSLRLEKPGSDLARIGNEANGIGSFGNNVMSLLTDNERAIMDLVAEGLSDSEIARVLGVSPEIVRIHLDHARQKLGISSRTEMAALALSRRYGAMSILIAAILAALDDSVDAGHTATESFTVMAANGTAEVVTIKIGRKEAVTTGTSARAANKDRAGAVIGTSAPTSKLVDPGVENPASSLAQAALNASRLGSSSYSTFMIAAFAALIYDLDGAAHAAQSFDFGDGLADVFTATASDAKALAAVAAPSFANFEGAAPLPATAAYDGAFAFEFAQGGTIARDGSEHYVGDAHAEDSGSDGGSTNPQGSGTVNAVAAAANVAPQGDATQAGEGQSEPELRTSDNGSGNANEHAKHEPAGDGLNHGQSQKVLHESDNGSGAAKGHAKDEAVGDGLNHGQSKKALHESDNGSEAAKGHAKHEATGEDTNHGQAHGDLHASEEAYGSTKQHAKHDPHADDLETSKPQHETAPINSANDAHSASKLKVGEKERALSDHASHAKSAVGTELGDSFHFKNGTNSTSSDILDLQQLEQGSEKAREDGHHVPANEWPVLVRDAHAIDLSDAQHDFSGHVNYHAAHDLIV